jgi:hypothetical protein
MRNNYTVNKGLDAVFVVFGIGLDEIHSNRRIVAGIHVQIRVSRVCKQRIDCASRSTAAFHDIDAS